MTPHEKFLLLVTGYLTALRSDKDNQYVIYEALRKVRSYSFFLEDPERTAWEYACYVLGLESKPEWVPRGME